VKTLSEWTADGPHPQRVAEEGARLEIGKHRDPASAANRDGSRSVFAAM
jgi:hypothetical protein